MPSFSGRYQYLDRGGRDLHSGPCRLSFDETTMTLVPGTGPPLAFDLGDIDELSPSDYELSLRLYTGRTIVLNQFAKAFQNLAHDLAAAYRDRLVQCLLLEDLQELLRVDACIRLESPERDLSRPAELRLYRSNLAVLPSGSTGFQWRLADLDSVDFDESTYAFRLKSGPEQLTITKLAKRTAEFNQQLNAAVTGHIEKSAAALRDVFPWLDPDQFQDTAILMKEGRAVPITQLEAIHPRTGAALAANAVDEALKPYFEFLKQRTSGEGAYAGFKLIRPEPDAPSPAPEKTDTEDEAGEMEEAAPDAPEEDREERDPVREDVLYWFFFPLQPIPGAPVRVVAWEACSESGRATYLFRVTRDDGSVAEAIRTLNRAIVALNFRREPIYLPDEKIDTDPRYRRYAIAARRLPFLRTLRKSFMGRALHTSFEAWQKLLLDLAAKA